MKEFRIARCLDISKNGIPVIRKYAIFKDGAPRHLIETDDEGREYFSVPNWINNDPEMDEFNYCISIKKYMKYMKYCFAGKPKDMIESIRRGYGDVICCYQSFLRIDHVLYFLDRDYGESLRKKTIESWKDAKFAYGLYCDSISAYGLYCDSISVNTCGQLEYGRQNIYFDSAKDAIELATKIAEEAYQKAFRLAGLPWKRDAEYLSFFNDFNPLRRIIFSLLEDVHEEGDILKVRDDASLQKAISLFKIKQEVVKEDNK